MVGTSSKAVFVVSTDPSTGNRWTVTLTEAQRASRDWFAEHILWAFGRVAESGQYGAPSVVASAVRAELQATGMPDHVIEKTLEDAVWAVIKGGWTSINEDWRDS